MAERASRTSSSLTGLMAAVTIFIFASPVWSSETLERVGDEADEAALAPVLALDGVEVLVRVGVLVVATRGEAGAEVVHRAEFPHRVRERVVVLVRLVADVPGDREFFQHRQRVGEVGLDEV